jgi:hypothetical protein
VGGHCTLLQMLLLVPCSSLELASMVWLLPLLLLLLASVLTDPDSRLC